MSTEELTEAHTPASPAQDADAPARPEGSGTGSALPCAETTAGGHPLCSDWLARFVLIWGGYAVSAFAGNAASYAGIWYVTESTGSPLALAVLYVLAFLPMGLLSPFGGVLADKHNRKAIIIALGLAIALPKSVRSLD